MGGFALAAWRWPPIPSIVAPLRLRAFRPYNDKCGRNTSELPENRPSLWAGDAPPVAATCLPNVVSKAAELLCAAQAAE